VFVTSAALSGLALTLAAVLGLVLGVWRFGVDPGWTKSFFIASGLLSHHQSWFAVAIAAQASAFIVNRWVANQPLGLRTPAVVNTLAIAKPAEPAHRGTEEQFPIAA
jgi:hypothetical protein